MATQWRWAKRSKKRLRCVKADLSQKIYVAGHRGMVGSSIVRNLQAQGFTNIVYRTHAELDLTDQASVRAFFSAERPDLVYLAAAKVGGIIANNTYPEETLSWSPTDLKWKKILKAFIEEKLMSDSTIKNRFSKQKK